MKRRRNREGMSSYPPNHIKNHDYNTLYLKTLYKILEVSSSLNPSLHPYGPMELNYGVVLPDQIQQSYRDVSQKY
jgi:hypothetical protein